MSISSEITRLQNAKANLKDAIEDYFSKTIPNDARLTNYPNYMVPAGCYGSAPTANGVYIKYTGSKYSDYNILWEGQTPVGVGLVTSNVSILIHPNETINISWGGYGTKVPNCFSASTAETAKTDFNGKTNTDAVILQVGAANAPAFNWARNTCTYADGSIGWLPSCGEMEEIRLNNSSINSALSLIGGTQFNWTSNVYQCSTHRDSQFHWFWSYVYENWKLTTKDTSNNLRARSVTYF